MNRRNFIQSAAVLGGVAGMGAGAAEYPQWHGDASAPADPKHRRNRIGVSSYSFWQFRGERLDMPTCIDMAASMGFDGVELLLVQMTDTSDAALARLKAQAHAKGLALMGFSTHQGFVYPDAGKRRSEVEKTIGQIEMAAKLGIPTMRINTGTWGTSASFDDLMANKGIEAVLPGHTEEEGFTWVIDAIQEILPAAEKYGVVLGLENHWGLGRTAKGVLRIAEAIDSPWLRLTLDTGNFLENQYEQFEMMAASAIPVQLVQAKTYFGGGRWYELDIDYGRIAKILREHDYQGWISLEFEGNEDAATGVPKSLALLRKHFGA
jgi:sugar phosphate isomerase/epimerase